MPRFVAGDKALGIHERCRVSEILERVNYIIAFAAEVFCIDYSTKVYGIRMKNISKENIYVYSIDEVCMDDTVGL